MAVETGSFSARFKDLRKVGVLRKLCRRRWNGAGGPLSCPMSARLVTSYDHEFSLAKQNRSTLFEGP